MKKLIFILAVSIAILFLGCNRATNNQTLINSPNEDTVQPSNKVEKRDSQMKTDTISSDIEKINLIIAYYPYQHNDYVVEQKSGVSDTSKYATERGVNKGQIYFPCEKRRLHDYKILAQKIINIISIKYDINVYDKTDYIFTRDTIFEVHTSTTNAGIFTNSDIKYMQNNIDFSSKTKEMQLSNKQCTFNNYLFDLVLNFCRKIK